MTQQVEIDELDIPILIELYNKKKQQDIERWDAKIEALTMHHNLTNNTTNSSYKGNAADANEYPNTKWSDKVIWVLKKLKRATSAEVLDEMTKYQPDLKERRKSVMPTVSTLLKEESVDPLGKFKRQEVRGVFYYEFKKEAND